MPARSQAQRGYLNWKFGHAWTKRHHFDNPGKLPARSKAKRRPGITRSDVRREQMVARFAAKQRGKRRG